MRVFIAGGTGVVGRGRAARRRRAPAVNGQPGGIGRAADGRIVSVLAVDVADGRIHAVRSIVNPEKLAHLGETANLRDLLHGR